MGKAKRIPPFGSNRRGFRAIFKAEGMPRCLHSSTEEQAKEWQVNGDDGEQRKC